MKNKSKLNSLKKGYVKTPYQIYNMNLSGMAMALYGVMSSCSEEFNPSIGFLKQRLGLSRNTLGKYITELLDRNIIGILTKPRKGFITKYYFIQPKDWKLDEDPK